MSYIHKQVQHLLEEKTVQMLQSKQAESVLVITYLYTVPLFMQYY